jgi:hypothetical protein
MVLPDVPSSDAVSANELGLAPTLLGERPVLGSRFAVGSTSAVYPGLEQPQTAPRPATAARLNDVLVMFSQKDADQPPTIRKNRPALARFSGRQAYGWKFGRIHAQSSVTMCVVPHGA